MDVVLFNLHDVVLLTTVFLCLLFSFFLFALKRDSLLSNLFFIGFLLCNASIPLDILIHFGAAFREWAIHAFPSGFYIFEFGYWLEGPTLLWYTRSMLYKGYTLRRYDLIYLIPFAIYVLHKILRYSSLSIDLETHLLAVDGLYSKSQIVMLVTYAREIFRVLFGVLCVLELRKHRSLIHDNYSNIEAINFNWLRFLIYGFLGIRIWSFMVVTSVNLTIKLGWAINFAVMGLIGNYAILLLIAVSILLCARYANEIEGVDKGNLGKFDYAVSYVDEEQVRKIEKLFNKDKIYLNSNLTLADLSIAVGVPEKLVSIILNHHFKKRFYEFVNDYRIEDAKQRLCSRDTLKMSITEIMCDVGFNNRATFNSMFKRSTGVTPREYRKRKTV